MDRNVHLVVYGATGFTGMKVAQEIAANPPNIPNFTWAIAGRCQAKLDDLCLTLTGPPPLVWVADAGNASLLTRLFSSSRVVISCVGPFRTYGHQVVQACISAKADYVDICGETEFIERIYAQHDQSAIDAGISIVPCCGYDSIPADMGCLYTKIAALNQSAQAISIDMFVRIHSPSLTINVTTLESLILGFKNAGKLAALRKQHDFHLDLVGQKPVLRKRPYWDESLKAYNVLAFVADVPVVKLGQKMVAKHKAVYAQGIRFGNYQPSDLSPVHFGGYFSFTSYLSVLFGGYFGFLVKQCVRFNWLEKLVLKYPAFFTFGIFNKNGPTPQQIINTSFETTFRAIAFDHNGSADAPNVKLTTLVKGPEPGYVTTPKCVVTAAEMILTQRKLVPLGVLTPAVAFSNVSDQFIEKLGSKGISFNIVK